MAPVRHTDGASVAPYREFAPPPDLRAYVACTWTGVVVAGVDGRAPIIPDGCADIISVDGTTPHVAGPATETQLVRLNPSSVVTGIRFRPGATAAVLRCSAAELLNQSIDLSAVCGPSTRMLVDELTSVPGGESRRTALEQWVRVGSRESGVGNRESRIAAQGIAAG
jgi:hypothetical protein